MLRCEIIRTCSHEKVAAAAVASVGPRFRDRVTLLAVASGKDPGAYVAELVRRFGREANDRELAALARATAGSDMPILDGLRWIVEFMIDGDSPRAARAPKRIGARGRSIDRCARAA
ncbi:MAG: hypothetical protein ACK4MV_01010 [Beijerinckiaceae bacterium]